MKTIVLLVLTKSVETVKEYYGSIPTFINIPRRDPMKGLLPLWSANKNLHQTVHSGDKGLLAWWFLCTSSLHLSDTSSLHISDIWPASGKALFLPQDICLSPSTEIWKEEALTTPVGVSLCRRAHLMSQQAWEVHIHMCRSQMRERSAHMPDLLNLSHGRPRALLVSILLYPST